MRLNFKTIIIGGLVFYAVQFILSMITGPLIHENILASLYKATADGSEELIFVGDLDHASKGLAFVNPVTPAVTRVGGTASFLSSGTESSFGSTAIYIGGIVGALAIFSAGGWYLRRRWLAMRL